MNTTEPFTDLAGAVQFRTAAYSELSAARAALDLALARLKDFERFFRLDTGTDAVLSSAMRGREAIARFRVEEAKERVNEANRDLSRARELSASRISQEFEIEHID